MVLQPGIWIVSKIGFLDACDLCLYPLELYLKCLLRGGHQPALCSSPALFPCVSDPGFSYIGSKTRLGDSGTFRFECL